MDVPEIKDREHLEAWLRTRSREECVAIAHRAAMRVAPLWMGKVNFESRKDGLIETLVFRPLLVSGVAALVPSPEIKKAAGSASNLSAEKANVAFAATAIAVAFTATATATAANAFASAAAFTATASVTESAFAFADPAAAAAIWDAIWQDLKAVHEGIGPLSLPLWLEAANPLATDWTLALADLVARGEDWEFWIRWYEAALRGAPLNWKMQEEIALLPSDVWEGDVAGLAAAIAAIEIKYAIDATPNGEIVAINPESGKLYLTPDTDLPADIATYANRKLAKAFALFGENPANQYTALGPELKLLADILADASNLPVEIFDACASVSRRVTARAENGECPRPEKDALIADFLVRIREAGADILGNDPKTQQILRKRHGVRSNASLTKASPIIMTAAGMLSDASEGFLAKAIVTNANEASNSSSDPETRSLNTWKLASRVFRMRNLVVTAIALSPANLALQMQGLHYLMFSPEVSKLVALLFSYFGF